MLTANQRYEYERAARRCEQGTIGGDKLAMNAVWKAREPRTWFSVGYPRAARLLRECIAENRELTP